MDLASISVIIPTYNRAGMLSRVLPSYLASSLVGEVLVVDDGSQDETRAVVEGFCESDARVRLLLHERNLGLTFGRNTGLEHARSELLLFSEDDLELDPPSVEILVQHMEQSGADIIAGRRIWMRLGETREEALDRANHWRGPVVSTRLMEHFGHAVTASDVTVPLVDATMLVRRAVTEQVRFAGCYPGNAWREESDFQLTAQQRGFRVVFCPHSVCYHHDRATAGRGSARISGSLVYLYWVFRNNLTFLRRHRRYLRRTHPEALLLGSPLLGACLNLAFRSAWLARVEVRRAGHALRSRERS
ncbi:glycosyltransferase family 2 protein [Chloroflexota bacterium]